MTSDKAFLVGLEVALEVLVGQLGYTVDRTPPTVFFSKRRKNSSL